jgi:hypothetical protein
LRENNADVSKKFRRAAFGCAAAARLGEVTDWLTKQTSFLGVESDHEVGSGCTLWDWPLRLSPPG